MKLIWIWNERTGVKAKEGSYAQHWTLIEGQGDYDSFVRGYALILRDKRQVRLSLSEANSYENSFFPEKAFRYFTTKYPGYQVIREC